METPRSKTTGTQTASISYLNALVEECTAKPPPDSWTIGDLMDRGLKRNTARLRMIDAEKRGEIKSATFLGKLYFLVAAGD